MKRHPQHRAASLRPRALAAALALSFGGAHALPQDGQVSAGSAQIGAPAAGLLQIRQDSSRAVIDWRSFGIAAGETVRILQPGSTSVLLNRVTGTQPSDILGRLQANGQVFLSNPNGILFGAGAMVDVGALVATTLSLNTADFMAGRISLGDASARPGSIINHGLLRAAPGGHVALVAAQVANHGRIETPSGTTALATGRQVDLDFNGDRLLAVRVNLGQDAAQLLHDGQIVADSGGRVLMTAGARDALLNTVLNVSGRVSATGITERNGEIHLDSGAGGSTRLSGAQLDVSSAAGQGGRIDITGRHISLSGPTVLDLSGAQGGGRARIGGDWQGRGDLPRAQTTDIGAQVDLRAQATRRGQGGTVVLWSDGATRFAGRIDARGGPDGGNGGQVEVSGRRWLDYTGRVDVRASAGQALGLLLLDPDEIDINLAGPDIAGDGTLLDLTTTTLASGDYSGKISTLTSGAIEAQLDLGRVELQASGDIRVNGAINASGNTNGHGLTLTSTSGIIRIDQSITLKNNAEGFAARTGGAGAIQIGTGAVIDSGNATLELSAGTSGIDMATGSQLKAGTGAISLSATGGTLNTQALSGQGITLTSSATGAISLQGNLTATGDIRISGGSGGVSMAATALIDAGAATVQIDARAGGNAGGTLDLAGGITTSNATASAIALDSGSGNLSLGNASAGAAGTIELTHDGAGSQYAGSQIASGHLRKSGSGILTLTEANGYAGDTQVNAGTLRISGASGSAGSGTLTLSSGSVLDVIDGASLGNAISSQGATLANSSGAGTLSGAIDLGNADSTLQTAGSGLLLSGIVGGSGGIVVSGSSGATLSAANTYTGTTQVQGGTLTLSGGAALADSGTLSIGSSGTVALGADNETIATLTSSGAFTGTGTLTASTYSLTGGTVSANLGAGTLTASTGSTTLSGASGATVVNITSGTLSIGAADRLADTATVDVATGATLALGASNDTIGAFTSAGNLTGTGTLSAATYGLTAGTIGANLGTGSLSVAGGAVQLDGTAAVSTVQVASGTLTLGAGADRLSAAPAVRVDAGATLDIGASPLSLGTLSHDGVLITGGALQAAAISGNGQALLGADVTTTAGDLVLGAVTLTAGVALNAGAARTLSLGTVTGQGHDLQLTGLATLGAGSAGLGALTALQTLRTQGSLLATQVAVTGAATLAGDVTTSAAGGQSYGSTTLATSLTLDAGATQPLTLGTVTGQGFGLSLVGVATLGAGSAGIGALSAAQSLRTAGSLSAVSAQVTGAASLAGDVTTTGSAGQSFGSLTLLAPVTLSAGAANPVVTGTVTGQGHDLSLVGTATLGAGSSGIGALSAAQSLRTLGDLSAQSLDVTGDALLGGNVTTSSTAGQVWRGTLSSSALAARTLDAGSGNLTLAAGASGAFDLTLRSSGTTVLAGTFTNRSVDTDAPGSVSLSVASGSTADFTLREPLLCGSLSGGAVQFTASALTLCGDLSVTASSLLFAGTVDSDATAARALQLQVSGLTDAQGAMGSLRRLSSISVDGGGSTRLVSAVRTTGAQTYANALDVAGTLTLDAAGGDIVALNAANDWRGTLRVDSTGRVSLRDAGALDLGVVNAASLNVFTGGALLGSGVWTVSGATALDAGSSAITAQQANRFGGELTLRAGSAMLTSAQALTLGSSSLAGDFALTVQGDVAQTGTLTVGGALALTQQAAAATVALDHSGNRLSGPVSVQMPGGTLRVGTRGALVLGASDWGASRVLLTSGGSISQTGVLRGAAGGLTLAAPAASDVLLDTQANALTGTVDTTAGVTLGQFSLRSDVIRIGSLGVNATRARFVSDDLTSPTEGVIVLTGLAGGGATTSGTANEVLVLQEIGNTGNARFGVDKDNGIKVYMRDGVAVSPNASNTFRPVYLVSPAASATYPTVTGPTYEFANQPTYRVVIYNGVIPETAQSRAALSAAVGPLRDSIREATQAGFSKENLRKQLVEGVVLQTGPGRPGADRIDGAAGGPECEADASLQCP